MPVTTSRIKKTTSPHRMLAALFTGLVALTLGGCGMMGPKTYAVKGEADANMNRDSAGNSLSVAVRVYQLKDATEFSKLTFDTVASGRPESELLGDALLRQTEIIMVPNGKHANKEKLLEETKYVGIVGLFRQPDPNYWRFLVEADKVRSDGLSFKIQDCYLVLLSPKPAPIPGQPANAAPVCTYAPGQGNQPQSAQPLRKR